MYSVYLHVIEQFNAIKSYGVDKVLMAAGLGVHKDFRRRGIAVEMLKARVNLCQAFGIKLTSTFFTAIGSQIAAQRAGFEENLEFE
jgi:GNAT superfamily N-acetyltransferase